MQGTPTVTPNKTPETPNHSEEQNCNKNYIALIKSFELSQTTRPSSFAIANHRTGPAHELAENLARFLNPPNPNRCVMPLTPKRPNCHVPVSDVSVRIEPWLVFALIRRCTAGRPALHACTESKSLHLQKQEGPLLIRLHPVPKRLQCQRWLQLN